VKILALLVCLPLAAQEPGYFPEEAKNPWVPAWEFSLRHDRVAGLTGEETDFQQTRGRLRLRWTWESGPWEASLGSWHSLGEAPRDLDQERYENQPSSGSRLDLAQLRCSGARGSWFGDLRVGLQENLLISHESWWDKDLRVLGLGLRAGFKGEDALQEFGLRGISGRVPTLLGGHVDLTAVQAVLAVDTGPLSWTFHASRWDLAWDATHDRERPLPGQDPRTRQKVRLDAVGGSVVWNGPLPVEARAVSHRNPGTRDDGVEAQLWIGSRRRVWWPQADYVWQRFGRTGTFSPVNGDDWWWISNARGPRYEVALPLPAKWLFTVANIRHRWYPGEQLVTRWNVGVSKRF
jgi:hypothetical protein